MCAVLVCTEFCIHPVLQIQVFSQCLDFVEIYNKQLIQAVLELRLQLSPAIKGH